jgi:hypothetical protein
MCLVLDHERSAWLEAVAYEPIWMNAFVFTSCTFFEILAGNRRSIEYQQSSRHFIRTLQLLHERLAGTGNDTLMISDPIVMSVVALAVHSFIIGQYNASKLHLVGLSKVIKLRGGISKFQHHPKLQVEFLR